MLKGSDTPSSHLGVSIGWRKDRAQQAISAGLGREEHMAEKNWLKNAPRIADTRNPTF